jgi:hypothetical protein
MVRSRTSLERFRLGKLIEHLSPQRSTTISMATITATFHDRETAERAVDDLIDYGINRGDISLVVNGDTRGRYFEDATGERVADDRGASVAKGAAGGGVVGGSLGAIAGGLLLGGTITAATGGAALPFLIAGPIAGALAGGGAGAAAGSVLGALAGAGVPEPEARAIESDVREGGIVLAVQVDEDEAPEVRSLLRRDDAVETSRS